MSIAIEQTLRQCSLLESIHFYHEMRDHSSSEHPSLTVYLSSMHPKLPPQTMTHATTTTNSCKYLGHHPHTHAHAHANHPQIFNTQPYAVHAPPLLSFPRRPISSSAYTAAFPKFPAMGLPLLTREAQIGKSLVGVANQIARASNV